MRSRRAYPRARKNTPPAHAKASAHFSPGGPGFPVNVAMFKALASFLSTILFAGCPIRFLAPSSCASWPVPLEP